MKNILLLFIGTIILVGAGCARPESSPEIPSAASSPRQNTYTTTTDQATIAFPIKELSIKIEIPTNLSDLVYTIRENSDGMISAVFSTRRLIALDQQTGGKYCNPKEAGTNGIGQIDMSKKPFLAPDGSSLSSVKINNNYYFYRFDASGGPCSDNQAVGNLQLQQIHLLSRYSKTIESIQ